ncbi:hypothetical protein [Streptomyces palmae]|uniref:Uncharacterized protein n=1 Tax=Streptomyces palmae TaxID=1701085 RepID=A0A4Z0H8P3_9ACTN|nr:hypothetical protein [Streptomyces palmae]TGB08308.1 hypothetical protein E4099_15670 [Streptomyces palmae]
MESIIKTIKMADRPVMSACLLGSSLNLRGTGLSGAVEARFSERPTQAPAVAAVAKANAYAFAAAANGAGSQQTQHHTMWAFRGLDTWSYPA